MTKSLKPSRIIRHVVLLGTTAGLFAGASVAGAQSVEVVPATPPASAAATIGVTDTTHRRPRAIEYSDWYARRLEIHKLASYTELALFATEYYLGEKLLNTDGTDTQKNLHQVVAGGLGVLFTVNTVTGVLASVGGVAITTLNGTPIAIVRTGTSTFITLSRICPHQGSTINQISTGFRCPNHLAQFDIVGNWVGGQRTSNMFSYSTSYDPAAGTLTIG